MIQNRFQTAVFLISIAWMFFSASVLASPTVDAVEKTLQEEAREEDFSKKLILLPIVYYTPETKAALGALMIKNLWREKVGYTSNILGTASITLNNQILTSIAPRLYFDQGDWELGGTLFYSYFPNKYYGRGVNSSVSNPEPYVENTFLIGAGIGRRVWSQIFVRFGVAQDQRKIIEYENNGLIQSEINAVAQSLEVQSFTSNLEWDDRDLPQSPRQGSLYKVSHVFYSPKDREGGRSIEKFRKVDFDFRQYYLLKEGWVGAFQVLASEVQGDQIPFQYLNSIGGGSRMRGYYAGQYRDKSLGLFQAELRYDWKPKWVLSTFAGVARMEEQLANLSHADSYYSGGFGVHYVLDPENKTKLRLDLGFTGKDTGFYFLIGDAF